MTFDGSRDEENVLVVVVNDPVDLQRARTEGWYRIPVNRAPARVGAGYLAFYLTGAFGAEERWSVRYYAPVRAFRLARRLEIIPAEPEHPRAQEMYYHVLLGALAPLPRPVPSRRLRRITFIQTTLDRLLTAQEINDLWVKSSAQERLWAAMKDQGVDAERQYPLQEDAPQYLVDFALFGPSAPVAVIVEDEPVDSLWLHEGTLHYFPAANGWRIVRVTCRELDNGPAEWLRQLIGLAN